MSDNEEPRWWHRLLYWGCFLVFWFILDQLRRVFLPILLPGFDPLLRFLFHGHF